MIFSARDPADFRVRPRHLFAYGWLNVPLSIAGLPLAIYIPSFYATELGMSLAAIGWILMLARISDIVTDPVIGILSDRTPERWGRRRLWMIFGIPLTALSVYMVFSPSGHVGFFYTFFWISLLYIAWTIVTIPYSAWGAELSLDYRERTAITGWREMLGIVGQLLVMALPVALPWLATHGFSSLEATRGESMAPLLHIVAIITVVTLFVSLAGLLWILPEVRVPSSHVNWFSGMRVIWRNGPFKRLILVNVFNGMGWTVCGTLFVFYVRYILEADLAATGWLLLVYYTAGVIGAPLCARGGNLIGKHRMWAWTIIFTCVAYLPATLLGPGDELWFALILSFTGLSIANGGILGSSMSADVIDIDTLRSGQQRGALFMALWALASKFAAALGALVGLNLLDIMGFVPGEHAQGKGSLLFMYIVLPIICWLIAAAIIWNYPITEVRHRRIRARVERRLNGAPLGGTVGADATP
jgi:glycoside/pentoside/hexuronide:cation symporter, GPH family